ncbi:MAG: ABC transporter permease, partial [Planctomycetota bacterium]
MAETEPITERRRSSFVRRLAPVAAPLVVAVTALALWEGVVWWREVPDYLLPAPTVVAQKL